MSFVNCLNQGVYETLISDFCSAKFNIEVFQYKEEEDALNAVPASPIAPALESGVIDKNGNAVVIVFNCKSEFVTPLPPVGWAKEIKETKTNVVDAIYLIMLFFSKFYLANIRKCRAFIVLSFQNN